MPGIAWWRNRRDSREAAGAGRAVTSRGRRAARWLAGLLTVCVLVPPVLADREDRLLRREQLHGYLRGQGAAPGGYPHPGQQQVAPGRGGWGGEVDDDPYRRRRLSPEERHELRRDIRDANREVYREWPPRRR